MLYVYSDLVIPSMSNKQELHYQDKDGGIHENHNVELTAAKFNNGMLMVKLAIFILLICLVWCR